MVQVAAIQMVSTHDIDANLEEARRLLAEAAGAGAKVAEMAFRRRWSTVDLVARASSDPQGGLEEAHSAALLPQKMIF